ncbi:glycosyl transferase [Candidatus Levyibacteriota bacterium]|nr:glycosyltransferase [Candidatus Levybacteria bacterium]MSU25820.1 glycosyltransferase family 4 protein [Candidatus Levybacteria bacterium]GDX61862.1 glycosyl transferase [Candidatus Levybacteria bacterium]
MKVAIVYDRVNKFGGAERVLLALSELFPDAPLFTSVYNPINAKWAKSLSIKTSFLQSFPYASKMHEIYPLLMPIAFESLSFSDYDIVISVTSEAAKGIITTARQIHICYILTPTRYLWSGYEDYFKNKILRFITRPLIYYLRMWDIIAAYRPDLYISISKETQSRVKKYYNQESKVIYPPGLELKNVRKINKILSNDYFLIVSRLISYKRINIAIEACNFLKQPLFIIGIGSDENRLRKLAGPTIFFLGNLTDEVLVQYYTNCRAFIFPGEEDFGLTVIEAQRYGKPVIAYYGGGAKETIIKGKTGEFFYSQNKESMIKVLKKFKEEKYIQSNCTNQAKKFSKEIFKRDFLQYIQKAYSIHKKYI